MSRKLIPCRSSGECVPAQTVSPATENIGETFCGSFQKGYRNRPLKPDQKSCNLRKSRVRSRVEHVFGLMSKLAHESRNFSRKVSAERKSKSAWKNWRATCAASRHFGKPWGMCVPIRQNAAKFEHIIKLRNAMIQIPEFILKSGFCIITLWNFRFFEIAI